MQRPRHRKSKSASGIEAIQKVQKPKAVPRLSTDSYSYADGSNANDMFMYQFGQNSSERDSGIPMKKLLAEEMSKEFETKRRSPSVIARLMGLEVLPSPKHVQRQQRRAVHSPQYDGRSTRGNSMEEQVFKDVYEDLEAAHIANRRCSSRWNANSIFMEPDMALIQEKFKEAKRLSTDEKFQDSKQLNEALEFLDSNKNILAKFLHHPDSMFVRPVHEPRVNHKISLGNTIAVLKPLNAKNREGETKTRGSARESSCGHSFTSHVKYEDGLPLEPYNRRSVHVSGKSPKALLQDKNEENVLPTRIVVLKPNVGKVQNAGLSSSSPVDSRLCPHRFKEMEERQNIGRAERISQRRNDSYRKVGSSIPMSEQTRELAREIARKMSDGSDDTIGMNMSTGFFGYAGDESSCDLETDSESDSEAFAMPSRKSFGHSNFYRYIDTSTNKEAKKRLSERWRTTHKYQDLEVGNHGSTLGEMLALPDRGGARPKYLHAKNLGRTSNVPCVNKLNASLDGPLGISSRDGWNNEAIRTSSRSRSLPPIIGNSSKRRTNRYESYEEGHLMHNKSVQCSRSKSVKGKRKEDFSSKISRSRGKKPLSCSHIFVDENETESSSEASFETQMTSNTKDILEDPPTFPTDLKTETRVIDELTIAGEPRSTILSSNSADLLPDQPHFATHGNSAAKHQEDSGCQDILKGQPIQNSPHLRNIGAEPESSQSSKEADHPSPVSVLEVPFAKYATSSESFERVSAELHGLRMQLKLLKMESGTFVESSTLEEEVEQLSPTSSEVNHTPKLGGEGWEIPYALDVLIDSGIEESDFDMFRTTWYSRDSVLDPKLFDTLENKYCDETNGCRSERRLLFDRINSLLSDIFQDHVDLYPWVTPKSAGVPLKSQNEGVRDALEKLINRNLLIEEISNTALDREMQWPDRRGEIDAVGGEIEFLLIDELITDVMYCN